MITETPTVTSAESVPAIEPVEQEVSLQDRLNNATEEEYKTWERTGDMPAIKPKIETPPAKTGAPAASKEEPAAAKSDEPPKVESAPAPAAGKPQKKRNEEGRVAQLLEERKREREESDAKWASRFEELEKRLPKAAEEKPATEVAKSSDAKQGEQEPDLGGINSKTGKPFTTIAEWQKEHSAWLRAQVLAEVDGRLKTTEQQRAQTERERSATEEMNTKLEAGREKYPDFDKVARNPDLLLPRGCAADEFVRRSEIAPDVLYYLGQHPDILQKFYRYTPSKDDKPGVVAGKWEQLVHPTDQWIELAKIEARLILDASSTPIPVPKPPATTKQLPPPPTVLSAKNTVAGDPVEDAIKRKSFPDYEKSANEAERKARRH